MSREALINAIRQAALSSIVDKNGRVLDASVVTGYVVKIHDDEGDELFGTVDVQEYNVESTEIDDQGLHEGVLLNANQNIVGNVYMIPRLYSDVTICKDSISGVEYISTFSLVDLIHIEAGKEITVGAYEREEYDPEGGDDIEDKAYTKNEIVTHYDPKEKKTTAESDNGDKSEVKFDSGNLWVAIGDNVTIHAGQEEVLVEVGETSFSLKDGEVTVKTKDVKIDADGDVSVSAGGNASIEAKGNADIKASGSCTVNAPQAQITGGQLTVNGTAAPSGSGPFCGIPVCPFSGAPHVGNMVAGT